jgi:peptide/nickel transport system permease protein
MKLIEDDATVEEDEPIEQLLGIDPDAEETGWRTRLAPYRAVLEEYVIAPAKIAAGDWRALFGFAVVGFYLFMAYVWAPMYPRPLYQNVAPRLVQPFDWRYTQEVFGVTVWQYPLGTNDVGQGILHKIVIAAPRMMELVLAGAVISVGIAVFMGTVAGYKGGFVDDVLMGITDVVLTIPGLPLVVLLAAVFTPTNPIVLGMILAIDNWPGLARTLRSQVLTIREEEYVESSRAMDVPTLSIVKSDVVPQMMPFILVNAASAGKGVITEAVGLYFLGFLPNTVVNWGEMMDSAYSFGAITNEQWFYMLFWPMLALALLSFGLVLLAQGLDQIFNPRLRARHVSHDADDADEESAPHPSNA